MAAPPQEGLPPLLCTTDDVLINHHLLSKIAGGSYSYPFINEANVYSKPPHQLAAEHLPAPGEGSVWYFFSRLCYTSDNQKRRSRMVVAADDVIMGRWHPETRKREVSGTVGGYLTKLSYKAAAASGGWERSGWVMAEYSYSIDDIVLCKVYRSSLQEYAGLGAQPTTTRVESAAPSSENEAAAATHRHTLRGEPPQLAPGAGGHRGGRPLVAAGLLHAAERFLMTDDDGVMASRQILRGEDDIDAFYRSYLLGCGGGDELDDGARSPN